MNLAVFLGYVVLPAAVVVSGALAVKALAGRARLLRSMQQQAVAQKAAEELTARKAEAAAAMRQGGASRRRSHLHSIAAE